MNIRYNLILIASESAARRCRHFEHSCSDDSPAKPVAVRAGGARGHSHMAGNFPCWTLLHLKLPPLDIVRIPTGGTN